MIGKWIRGYNLNFHWSSRDPDCELGIKGRPFVGFMRDDEGRGCWMVWVGNLVLTWDYLI